MGRREGLIAGNLPARLTLTAVLAAAAGTLVAVIASAGPAATLRRLPLARCW